MALILIRELGMRYPTENSKHKRKMAVYRCSGCGKENARQVAQIKSGYTNWCVTCGIKNKGK